MAAPNGRAAIRSSQLIRPSPDLVVQRMGPATVIVHLRTDRIYELNRTASGLWELLGAGCTRSQLQRRMQERFDVDAARLTRELDDMLASLRAARLIRVS